MVMRLFRDRADAGRQLAAALEHLATERPVVLGIPRGGVAIARHVADALGGVCGVIVARKLGAPDQPELAIGAVAADGESWLDESLARLTGADDTYLARERETGASEAARRERLYAAGRPASLRGRVVVIVDDGIATGATALVAIRSARAKGASRVILAVPVAPPETLDRLRQEADQVVALHEPSDFVAVGQFYEDFRQVTDDDVRRALTPGAPGPT